MAYDPTTGSDISFAFDEYYLPRYGRNLYFGDAAYVPRWGGAILFDFRKLYDPPAGNEIYFSNLEIEPIVRPCDGEPVPYSVPDGGNIVLELYDAYIPPSGDDIRIELADCAGDVPPEPPPPWYQIPVGISPGVRIGFAQCAHAIAKPVNSAWGGSRLVEPTVAVGYSSKNNAIERSLDLAWKGLGQLYKTNRAGWKRLLAYDARVQALWRNLGTQDLEKHLCFADCEPVDESRSSSYGHPPPKDLNKKLLYGDLTPLEVDRFDVPWGNPPAKDRFHTTVWGKKYYEEICVRDYVPPVVPEIDFNLDTEISHVGTGDHINFYFDRLTYDRRCKWREPSGWRDAYDFRPPVIVPTGLSLRTYIMMSTAQLNRLPDNLPIPVKSITMSLDWDSVHWSLAATVIGGDVRDLSPTDSGPIEVEAKINGTTWNCLVDDWSRDVGFASEARGIRGRSLTAILGVPWAPAKTEVQSQQRTAVQLMEEQLVNSGWTINCSIDDWLLPAGTMKIDAKTPLAVIKRIAATAGGFVRPDPAVKTLHILPRYKVAPWAALRADADLILPGAMVIKDQGSWDGRAEADSVHMVGSISVSAKRTGSAGTRPAPDVNDELITEVAVARARANFEIGRCGRWQKHSLSLPVFSDAVPGVIFPGQVIGVDDDTSWLGFVTAVSVKADWGTGGLMVRQLVHLEVYCGD